jgi:hypothetical protein
LEHHTDEDIQTSTATETASQETTTVSPKLAQARALAKRDGITLTATQNVDCNVYAASDCTTIVGAVSTTYLPYTTTIQDTAINSDYTYITLYDTSYGTTTYTYTPDPTTVTSDETPIDSPNTPTPQGDTPTSQAAPTKSGSSPQRRSTSQIRFLNEHLHDIYHPELASKQRPRLFRARCSTNCRSSHRTKRCRRSLFPLFAVHQRIRNADMVHWSRN